MSKKRKARKRAAQKLKKKQKQTQNIPRQMPADVSAAESPETEMPPEPETPLPEVPEEIPPELAEDVSPEVPEEIPPEPAEDVSPEVPEEIPTEPAESPPLDETREAPRTGWFARIRNLTLMVVTAVLVGFMGYVMFSTMRGGVASVFGKCILQVVTGSMEPSIHTGDFIIVEKTDPAALQVGDIITFTSEQSDIYGILVTHRIKAINADGTFITMGDANPVEDALAVRQDQILGRYTRKARFCMMLGTFADLRKLVLLAVMIGVSVVAFYEMRTIMQLGRQVAEERQAHEAQQKEALIREAVEREIRRLESEGLPPGLQEEQHDTRSLDETEDGGCDRPV